MSETPIWLVWSNEHGAWWGPGGCGYTRIIERAGRYGIKEADQICNDANEYLPKGKTHEVRVLSPEGADILLNGVIDRIVKDAMIVSGKE